MVGVVAHARLSAPVARVTTAADPRLDGYRHLKDPALRQADRFVAESRAVVRRLLGGHHRVTSILTTEAALDTLAPELAATQPPPEILVADAALLRSVAGFAFHRGCLAIAERGAEPSLDAVLAALAPGPAIVLVLDDVADPDNVGALFRNAAAFGVQAVLLTARCGDPLYRKAIRVSMGETLRVAWARTSSWPQTAEQLRAHDVTPVALTPDGDDLETFARRVPDRLALVVGNEGAGLSGAARAACAASVGIPMRDSLNVATAAAIALYRIGRDRAAPGS